MLRGSTRTNNAIYSANAGTGEVFCFARSPFSPLRPPASPVAISYFPKSQARICCTNVANGLLDTVVEYPHNCGERFLATHPGFITPTQPFHTLQIGFPLVRIVDNQTKGNQNEQDDTCFFPTDPFSHYRVSLRAVFKVNAGQKYDVVRIDSWFLQLGRNCTASGGYVDSRW